MSDHIDRIRAFRAMYEQNGGHASPEAQDAMALLGDYERLQAELADATLQQRAARIREEYLRELLQEACDLHSGVRPDSADDWKRRATDFLDSYKEQP